jgi:hypothetical protein
LAGGQEADLMNGEGQLPSSGGQGAARRAGKEGRAAGRTEEAGAEQAELAGPAERAKPTGRTEQAGSAERKESALGLRALAHPLRWKLIDLLGTEGSATATRCAEVLAESVASCAYHLGILAKYGYVELVPGQTGREKPWRLTSYRQDLSAEGLGLGLEGELAAEAAMEAFLDHEFARTRERLRTRSLEPARWRASCRVLGSSMWVTEEEFSELSEQMTELATRYGGRDEDVGSRPAGARLVRVFFSTSVAPEPAGDRAGAGRAAGDPAAGDPAAGDLAAGDYAAGDYAAGGGAAGGGAAGGGAAGGGAAGGGAAGDHVDGDSAQEG